MPDIKTDSSYREIDVEATRNRGFNICENNKRSLQNRYQLLHLSQVRSASSMSDMPHSPTPDILANERKILNRVSRETDSISNLMNLFKRLAQTAKTHNEGYFLFKYYVIGIGKEQIFEELGFKTDKRKRKEVLDNAYLLVAQATHSEIYKTETIITFVMKE